MLGATAIDARQASYTTRIIESLTASINQSTVAMGASAPPVNTDATDKNEKSTEEDASVRRPKGVPEHWIEKPSKKGTGIKYVDPDNARNDVRSMPGNPNHPHESSKRPYVMHKKQGRALSKEGKLVDIKSNESHIPFEEYDFNAIGNPEGVVLPEIPI